MPLPPEGKLVRDKIPEIIRAAGETPNVCQLSSEDRVVALRLKLREEAEELSQAEPTRVAEELADVAELLFAITEAAAIPWDAVLDRAQSKRIERGAFTDGTWLLSTRDGP